MVASRIPLQVSPKITVAFSVSCQFPFFPPSILGYLGIFCFPSGSVGKESACNAEDPGSTLGQEDPLEKRMTIHSSILAWRIPWTEESVGLQPMGLQSRAGLSN